jgi:hypothetical protein
VEGDLVIWGDEIGDLGGWRGIYGMIMNGIGTQIKLISYEKV